MEGSLNCASSPLWLGTSPTSTLPQTMEVEIPDPLLWDADCIMIAPACIHHETNPTQSQPQSEEKSTPRKRKRTKLSSESADLVTAQAVGQPVPNGSSPNPPKRNRVYRTPEEKELLAKQKQEKKARKEEEKKRREEEKKKREEEKKKREEEKKKREEEKAVKKAESEAKKALREEQRKLKVEQKQKLEEERKAKQEEKQRLAEEKKKAEEAKLQKIHKQQNLLSSFLQAKVPKSPVPGPTEQEGAASTSTPTHQSDGAISSPVVKRRRLEGLPLFRGVDLPPNTTLAPIIRSIHVLPEEQIDDCIRNGVESLRLKDTLAAMKNQNPSRKSNRPVSDCSIVSPPHGLKMKLLQFHENYRPAYYGTWTQMSAIINPRNPFKKDNTLLEYDYDSDADWEEEEPGEDLNAMSDEEEEEEEENSDDDGWLVPDGYVSEDEGMSASDADDEDLPKQAPVASQQTNEAAGEDSHAERNGSGKSHKAKEKLDNTKKSKGKKLQEPKGKGLLLSAVGPIFCISESELPAHAAHFVKYGALPMSDLPLDLVNEKKKEKKNNSTPSSTTSSFPDSLLTSLVKFIHGHSGGIQKIVAEFHEQHAAGNKGLSKASILRKCREIATKEKRHSKACWYVSSEVLKQLNIDEPTLSTVDSPLVSSNKKNPPCTPTSPKGTRSIINFLSTPKTPKRDTEQAIPDTEREKVDIDLTADYVVPAPFCISTNDSLPTNIQDNVNTEMQISDGTGISSQGTITGVECPTHSTPTVVDIRPMSPSTPCETLPPASENKTFSLENLQEILHWDSPESLLALPQKLLMLEGLFVSNCPPIESLPPLVRLNHTFIYLMGNESLPIECRSKVARVMGHVIIKYREDREKGVQTTVKQTLVLDEDLGLLADAISQCLEQGYAMLSKNVLRLLVALLSPPNADSEEGAEEQRRGDGGNKENERPSSNFPPDPDNALSQSSDSHPLASSPSSDTYPLIALRSALSTEKWLTLFLSLLSDAQLAVSGFAWAAIYHILSQQTYGEFLLQEPLWSNLIGSLASSLSYGEKFLGCKKYALLSLSQLLTHPRAIALCRRAPFYSTIEQSLTAVTKENSNNPKLTGPAQTCLHMLSQGS